MEIRLNGRVDIGALKHLSIHQPIAQCVAIQEKRQQHIK
jgi:hypothetical protein